MAKRLTMTYKDEVTTYDPIDVYNNSYSQINFQNILRKLARYEDLEEQGRLIELPCEIGDTIWTIDPDINFIDDFKVTDIDIVKEGIAICNHYLGYSCDFNDFGNTVFLTREEAEAKLKELRGEQE